MHCRKYTHTKSHEYVLEWNDCLNDSFEEHLLLMNLSKLDSRPLLKFWGMLEYLTKYMAKAGKNDPRCLQKLFFSESLGSFFPALALYFVKY